MLNKKIRLRIQALFIIMLTLVTALTPVSSFASSRVDNNAVEECGYRIPNADLDFSILRVQISIGNVAAVTLRLYGNYYVGGNRISLNGSESNPYTLTVSIYNGEVYASNSSGTTVAHGASLDLNRVYMNYDAGYLKLYDCGNSSTEGRNYLGNFTFTVNGGNLRMVNNVPLAHYAYGIISYEMNSYFEPAALRAQAVAAKSYGLSYISSNNVYYDTQDGYGSSTSCQAYRGYRTDRLSTMQYCLDVVGVALAYNGRIIPTFYGATNGGETALPSHIFGSSQYDAAYSVRLDDIEFEYVTGRRDTLSVFFGSSPENSRFKDFVLCKIRDEFDYAPCEVISVDDMYCYDPVEGTERNMQQVYVKATVRYWDDSIAVRELNFNSSELDRYALTDLDYSGDNYLNSKTVFTSNYEMYWGKAIDGGYELYFARHGHGLGLSQMGANVYADPDICGWDYRQILSFYYGNFELVEIRESNPELPLSCSTEINAYGVCNNSDVNFRVGPSTSYTSIGRVANNEHIDIVSVSGSWYSAIWNGHFGYIYCTYVDITMFPAPYGAVFTLHDGATNSSASLRVAPYSAANSISTLSSGTGLTVWATVGDWYYVETESGLTGFINGSYVDITSSYEYTGISIIPNKTPRIWLAGALNVNVNKPPQAKEKPFGLGV